MFNPGDVVQVFFPFGEGQDREGVPRGKDRPAQVLTVPDADGDFVAVALTGAGHHPNTLPITAADGQSLRLSKASFVRADKLLTFYTVGVIKKYGAVKTELVHKVRKLTCPALGCT